MKVLSVLLLVLVIGEAAAQSPIASLDKGTYTDKVPPIQKGDRSFTIEPSYVLSEMTSGRRDVKLTVTITAPSSGPGFLELRGVPVITSQDAAGKFQFTSNGSEDSGGVVHTRKYHFIVRIDDKVEPRRHQVRVAFALEGEPEKSESLRYFDLNVGVNGGGKLAPVPPAEDSQTPSFESGFFGGEKHTYQLNLQNSFPDYTVSIESITDSSCLFDKLLWLCYCRSLAWLKPERIPARRSRREFYKHRRRACWSLRCTITTTTIRREKPKSRFNGYSRGIMNRLHSMKRLSTTSLLIINESSTCNCPKGITTGTR
jgi:hypothetical protein